jgi:hypothetical protein
MGHFLYLNFLCECNFCILSTYFLISLITKNINFTKKGGAVNFNQ